MAGEARPGRDRRCESLLLGVRTRCAVADTVVVDELRIQLEHGLVVQAHTLGDSPAEAVKHHVGVADQLGHDPAPLLGERIDGNALLALCDPGPGCLGERHVGADRITAEGFELDDPGTEVGKHRAGERSGVEGPQVHDRDVVEGWVYRGCAFRLGLGRRRLAPERVAVLVDGGRRPGAVAGRSLKLHQRSELGHRPETRLVGFDDGPVVDHLRVLEDLRAAPIDLGEDLLLPVEYLLPLRSRAGVDDLVHVGPQSGSHLLVVGVGVVGPVRQTEDLHELRVLGRSGRGRTGASPRRLCIRSSGRT